MNKLTGVLAAWIVAAACATSAQAQDGALTLGGLGRAEDELPTFQEGRRGGRRTYTGDVWNGNARIFLGAKGLDETDWEPVEIQNEFAILTDFGPEGWPVHFAVDLRFGASDTEDFLGLDVESTSWEINFGVRRVFNPEMPVRPYVGGGIAVGGAAMDLDGDTESGSGVGFWLDFGVDFSVGGPFTVGLEFAWSFIPIDVAGVDTDAGGFHIGITFGFSY
jgi:outer membrane protein with beta-barrel domain